MHPRTRIRQSLTYGESGFLRIRFALQIDRLEYTMLDNPTAIRRPKHELASANGTQKNIERDVETCAATMERDTSHSRNVSDLDPDHLTLWQHPIMTLHYFFSEVFLSMLNVAKKTSLYKRTVCAVLSIVILFLLSGRISGPQQEVRP